MYAWVLHFEKKTYFKDLNESSTRLIMNPINNDYSGEIEFRKKTSLGGKTTRQLEFRRQEALGRSNFEEKNPGKS